jgi:tRNA nucleotidyltransferase/poly(A) polymerase
MPDYIYLLENRLSPAQQNALRQVRDVARDAGMTVFLAGGAVRDLTSGLPVRDLDFSVQGNALKLKKPLEKAGAVLSGEHEPSRTLFFWFPGSVRVEVSSARREEYPKPGKPVYHWAPILEDLRRRDFTANAMAISLNEGSWGLLLDPLNGFADIELRHLRLASNYGFIEDPIRMVRAVRFAARTGWEMDERTKTRYQNAKDEGLIEQASAFARGYELEEVGQGRYQGPRRAEQDPHQDPHARRQSRPLRGPH